MAKRNSSTIGTTGREILQDQEFDAPRQLVFNAWTKPDKIGRWWGPSGFTTTTLQMGFKPTGDWKFSMRSTNPTKLYGPAINQIQTSTKRCQQLIIRPS